MKCPSCDIDLLMAERQGVEIDYCSRCRGIWLDRGELDKILERSEAEYAAASQTVRAPGASDYADTHARRRPEDSQSRQEYQKGGRKKKSSFLTDLLEGLGE